MERQVARWVHWYKHQRLHSSIGDLPPLEFEHAHRQAQPVTPIPDVALLTSPPGNPGRFTSDLHVDDADEAIKRADRGPTGQARRVVPWPAIQVVP